ncbi:MAG: sulfatase [Acidobacteriota bacterium]
MEIADSFRRSVASPWRGEIDPRPGDHLELSLAVDPEVSTADPSAAVDAIVEVATGEGALELGRRSVTAAEGWIPWRLPLDDAAVREGRSATLDLRGEGQAPLVWSELALVRSRPEPAALPPNLILVSLDTVRADHLSLYGYERPTSPALDAFAADAWVFDRALSSSTWTLPSHGTMFTGLLPDQHGLKKLDHRLLPKVETAAERLRRGTIGYRTAAITDGGFLRPRWGFDDGFDRYDVTPGNAWEPKDAQAVFERAAAWVRDNRYRPFFLFVHSYEAHQPYINREGFADPFLDPDYEGPFQNEAEVFRPGVPAAEHRERVVGLYDGGIRRLDHYLGRFLADLEAQGLFANTAVILTSDHGEAMNEHGDFEHALGKVFDEHLLVPMVVRPPGGTEGPGGGRRVQTPVTTLDILPTLLDFAGLPDDELPGRSLRALAESPDRPQRPVFVHGLNSQEHLDESRYRLDVGETTWIVDRVRDSARVYDRRKDPALQGERPPAPADPGGGTLARALAWLSPGGYWTCLPANSPQVAARRDSALRLRGAWNGWRWLAPEEGRVSLALDPRWPSCAVFDIASGGGDRRLWLGQEALRLKVGEGGVRPIEEPPLAAGSVLPTARRTAAGTLVLDDEAVEELRALGYLQ